MAEPNGNGNGGPWWLGAVKTLGWQVALILGLVYFIAKDVREAQSQTLAELHAQTVSISELRSSVTELRAGNAEQRVTMEAVRRILSVMCAKSVKDPACIQ